MPSLADVRLHEQEEAKKKAAVKAGKQKPEWWREPAPTPAPRPAPVAPSFGVPPAVVEAARRGVAPPVNPFAAQAAAAPSRPPGLASPPLVVRPTVPGWRDAGAAQRAVASAVPPWQQMLPILPNAYPPEVLGWLKEHAPVGAVQYTYERIQDILQRAGEPVAGPGLAETAARGTGPARPGRPMSFAEMMAPPAMLAQTLSPEEAPRAQPSFGVPPGVVSETPSEAVERIVGGAYGRAWEMPGAVWRDVKRSPVTGGVARGAETAVKMALEAAQVPVRVVEESVGTLTQRAPGKHGVIPLAPTQHMTEEQEAQSAAIAESAGLGWHPGARWAISQGVLAAARLGASSINEYVATTYGNTPQSQAAVRQARMLGFSSYEAQREAVDRLMAGESLSTVVDGRDVMLYPPKPEDATPAELQRWQQDKAAADAYLAGVEARGEDRTSAAEEIQRTGRIPQSADLWNEVIGQFGLDPVNYIQGLKACQKVREARAAALAKYGGDTSEVEAIVKATAAAEVQALDDFGKQVTLVDDAVKEADDLPDALKAVREGPPSEAPWWESKLQATQGSPSELVWQQATQGPPGGTPLVSAEELAQRAGDAAYLEDQRRAATVLEARDKAASATYAVTQAADEGPRGNSIVDRMRNWLDTNSPIARTPRARAAKAANQTVQIFGTLLEGVDSPDEAAEIVHRFITAPETLVSHGGGLAISGAADEVRPLLAPLADVLDDPDFYSEEVFTLPEYLANLATEVSYQSLQAQGVGAAELSGWQKWVQTVKQFMGNLYLTSPGYAIRNWQGDMFTMSVDGTVSLVSRGTIDRGLARLGTVTPRIGGEAAGQMQLVEGLDDANNWVSKTWGQWKDFIGRGEESRYRRAFYTAFEAGLDWAPKIPDDVARLMDPDTVKAAEAGLAGCRNFDEMVDVVSKLEGLSPEATAALDVWAQGGVLSRGWSTARAVAVRVAQAAADFSLLDYIADETYIDSFLKGVSPFSYWLTHSAANWLKRIAARPGALTAYVKLNKALELVNQESGLPAKYAGSVGIPGTDIRLHPLETIVPFQAVFFQKKYQRENKNLVDELFQAASDVGLRAFPFIELPLRLTGVVGEPEEIGRFAPQTGVVLAITALLGIGGPQGIDLEGPIRQQLGMLPGGVRDLAGMLPGANRERIEAQVLPGVTLPAGEGFQANRIDNMLAAGAALNPTKVQPTLIAQDLNRRAHAGEFSLNTAMGVFGSQDKIEALAREQGWTTSQLEEAQTVLRDGVRLAQISRGLQTLTSYGLGLRATVLTKGEREQLALAQEKRATMYAPLTEQGSKEALQALQLTHPEMGPYGVRGSTLPGASPEDRTPAEQWQWNEYSRRGDEIRRGTQTRLDAIRRGTPWDNEASQALYDQQNADLAALRVELHIPETGEVFLSSVYGASPEEVQAIRRKDVLAAVKAGRPKAGDFIGADGTPDWPRYYEAVDGYWANLTASMREDPKIVAAAQDLSKRTGQLVTPDSLLAGVDLAAYEEYQRQYDSPTEAALNVWDTKVSGPAWDAFNAAQARGEKGAHERYIAPIQEMPAVDLIGQIQALYPGRWTDRELGVALRDMEIPSAATMSLKKKSPEEQVLSQASSGFWDLYNIQIPPGELSWEVREIPSVAAILATEDKSTIPLAEYQKAQRDLELWKQQNENPDWGSPEDWAEARRLDDEFEISAAEKIPGLEGIMEAYKAIPYEDTAARAAYRVAHPQIDQHADLQIEFGLEPENKLWAYYNLGGDAFWQYWNEELPPGQMISDLKDDPLIALLLNPESRETATPDQWLMGLEMARNWGEKNYTEKWGTPEDWAEARAQDEEFKTSAAETIPGYEAILAGYYDLPPASAERRAYKAAHPEIGQYFDAQDAFAATHELWAYYYKGGQMGTSSLGTNYRSSGGKRYYKRRGGGTYAPNFAYQAKKTPKVFLDTPLAWKSTMPKLEYRYRPTPQWKLGAKALGL